MRMMRLMGLAAAAAGLVLSARAATAGDLIFWTWRQEDRSQYTQLFADFNRTNPGINIRFEAFEPQNYQTVLSTAFAAGRGPDVVHVRAYGGLEQFARANYLVALTRESVPELANFTDTALASEANRADNQVYAVPFASQTLGLFYNREIFQRLNLQPAQTWEQFIALCRTLKERGLIPIANGTATGWMDEVLTSIFTGPFVGNEFIQDVVAGRATFEDPRYTGALERLLELRDFMPPGYTGIDYPTAQQLFLTGRAAMFAGGSFEIANFRRQAPNLQMEFIAPPAPRAGAPQLVSLFYDGGYAINARTGNRDDALKLVRFMATPAFGTRLSALLGNISPIRGAELQDPMLARVAQLNQNSVPYVMAVYFRYESPTGSELLQGAIQRMMAGSATPAQVGQEVTRGIAGYYAPFRR